jgi:hypothetical protein
LKKGFNQPLRLAKIDELIDIEDSRVQVAELDDVSRWIELAINNIPCFAPHVNDLLKMEEYFDESGLEGDDLHLWRAYRNLFAQRYAGVYDDILEVTDIIASDMFNHFVRHPLVKNSKSRFASGTIPFTFLGRTEDYYYTYTHDMERPVAVISIPQGRVSSVWNWLAIPHEIGHNIFSHFMDFEKDIWEKIRRALSHSRFVINPKKMKKMSGKKVIRTIWHFWLEETIADVFGILFTGPSFVMSRQDDAIKAANQAGSVNSSIWDIDQMLMTKHPTAFLRPLLGSVMLREIGFRDEADRLDERWYNTYPEMKENPELIWVDDKEVEKTELLTIPLDEMLRSFEKIVDIVLYHRLGCLNDSLLTDIIRFDNPDYVIAKVVAMELLEGTCEFARTVKPRHLLAASRIAFETDPENADLIHNSAIQGLIHFKKHHSD